MLIEKYDKLRTILAGAYKCIVAFSAGVDSTFLLKAAQEVLGDRVMAVTAKSVFCPLKETESAIRFCKENNIKHIIADIDVLSVEGVAQNPPDRCYICKKAIFSAVRKIAEAEQIDFIAEGSNADDAFDYRPGRRALRELGIVSPLADAGLTKEEIRKLSEDLGLATASKPSMACLASRIPYGDLITAEKLAMIEKAEEYLASLGLAQYRVRMHGCIARIEVMPSDFDRIMNNTVRESILERFTGYGFAYTCLDLKGFRSGSLNEQIKLDGRFT